MKNRGHFYFVITTMIFYVLSIQSQRAYAQALVFQHQEYEAPVPEVEGSKIPVSERIHLAEIAQRSYKLQVAQNLSKTEAACANITSIQCVNQKRKAAQIEGSLMGTEAALRELKNNNLEESDESLQKRADIDQLHTHITKVCRGPENFKICEESSSRLEESSAWIKSYYKYKWGE